MERQVILKKVLAKLAKPQDSEDDFISEEIYPKIEELENTIKKYYLVKTNLDDIKKKVDEVITNGIKSKFPKKDALLNKEFNKDFNKDIRTHNDFEKQKRELTKDFKKWIYNFRAHLNKMKLKNKDLDIKSILEPFTKFEIRMNN